VRSTVIIFGTGLLCGTVDITQGTLHLSKRRSIQNARSLEEHGIKIDDGFCTQIFFVWLDIKPYIFFLVPKGGTDIRMMYNGTYSGMNAHLWVPWFALPTIYALARALEVGTFMADSYIGEICLNFMLE
jgi:hypothetical protein